MRSFVRWVVLSTLLRCSAPTLAMPVTEPQSPPAAPTPAPTTVVHAGRLIDGIGRTVRTNMSILIANNRIVGVQPGFATPPGARVIDLSNKTVLPGLIDVHVHMMLELGSASQLAMKVQRSNEDELLLAVGRARRTLEAGFTSVRDVGGETAGSVALKRAIASGAIAGPRMWVSGMLLGPTGGHNDPHNGISEDVVSDRWLEGIVDSPEAGIATVRRMHRAGVDLIKISPSGGVATPGDDPNAQVMTDAEIKAIVDTAHTLGMKVAAHAIGESAVDNAAAIGADSIEHGIIASERSYAIMKQHGTYMVPTLTAGELVLKMAREQPELLDPTSVVKAFRYLPVMPKKAVTAFRTGVKMAFGTDAGVYKHGTNAQEFLYLTRAGIPAMDAIVMATGNAADLIGSKDIGAIAANRFADIIAVDGDPIADIAQLQNVTFVMKEGVVVKAAP